jgi:hypothetical protein
MSSFSDPMGQAYVNDAAELLRKMFVMAQQSDPDGVGALGPVDNALNLIGLLSGAFDGDDEARTYSEELWRAAANKIADDVPDVAHSL